MKKVQEVSKITLTTVYLERHRILCMRDNNDKNYIVEDLKVLIL